MPQINSSYEEVKVPFQKMTFSPDVPSSALGPNEYNIGLNVETDIRGIRSVSGDEEIFDTVPNTPVYVTSGYRNGGEYWFIVACENGHWYASNGQDVFKDITPGFVPFQGYTQATNITDAWNGTVPVFNDGINPPFFFPDEPNDNLGDPPLLVIYSNLIQPANIWDSVYENTTTYKLILGFTSTGSSIAGTTLTIGTVTSGAVYEGMIISGPGVISNTKITGGSGSTWTVDTSQTVSSTNINSIPYDEAPYAAGQKIRITGVNKFYDGEFTVTGSTTAQITYETQPGAVFPIDAGYTVGSVAPEYTWNYTPTWKSLTAGFIRLFSSPNVGNVLVAGNLTYRPLKELTADTTINDATVLNADITDDLVGATIDGPGIPQGTTVISVVVGVSLEMSAVATATATGVNIRLGLTPVALPVTIRNSQAFGLNDMPATWEPTILNVANEVEVPLRGQALDAFPCNGQLFICSYWDTVVMSPMNYATTSAPIFGVRLFNQGRGLLTANCWANTDKLVYGFDARDIWVFDGQNFTGLGNQRVKNFFFSEMDPQYFDRAYMEVNSHKNQIEIYYTDTSSVDHAPNKMLAYRYDLDCWNPPRQVNSATFACESPFWTYNSQSNVWEFNGASRTVVYAQARFEQKLVQKDRGYNFIEDTAIYSLFRRDNITLVKDYSGKVMVHRVLPEIYNIDAASDLVINPATQPELIGGVDFTIEGANSVGQAPQQQSFISISTDTDNPWAQVDQNAHRVISLKIADFYYDHIWMCTGITWQFTQVEDDR